MSNDFDEKNEDALKLWISSGIYCPDIKEIYFGQNFFCESVVVFNITFSKESQ